MSKPSRCLAVWLILASGLFGADARAQGGGRNHGTVGERRPFAKPGTPKQPERIRYIDVKHIKADLTLDTKKQAVSGTVTHTLSPLHPYLDRLELDCGSKLKVTKVTAGPKAAPCTFAAKGDTLTVTLDKAYGPGETFDLAIEYAGSPEHGLHFVMPDPAYPEKPMAIWTQGEAEDTHHWLPCYDYPNDRATSEMIVTVEKPLFVLSNGALVETREKRRRHHDLPLEDGRAPRQLPDLAGRGGLLHLSRQVRRPAGGLLRGQEGRRGDGPAVHGQDAADDRASSPRRPAGPTRTTSMPSRSCPSSAAGWRTSRPRP